MSLPMSHERWLSGSGALTCRAYFGHVMADFVLLEPSVNSGWVNRQLVGETPLQR